MSDCPFHSQISAYHDGELDAEGARGMEVHLAGCADCTRELAELTKISTLFSAKGPAEMLPLELSRLHQALERSTAHQPAETEFLRTAGMLSALAASILVISSVWLVEFPSRHATALSPGVVVVPASEFNGLPDWERTALTLRVEPFSQNQVPGSGDEPQWNQVGLADARPMGDNSVDAQVADWMVAGLSGGGSHANP